MKGCNQSFLGVLIGIFLLLQFSGCTSINPDSDYLEQLQSTTYSFSYEKYNNVLNRFVNNKGFVDYRALQQNRSDIDHFYAQIAVFSPDNHSNLFETEDARLAYWINSYNASVILAVVDNYPIDGVADVKPPWVLFFMPSKSGFFLFQRFTYGGVKTSLYYLENGILRDRFTDPRVHFALNCASRSCPELPLEPFYPDRIQEQLEAETRKFINDKRNVYFDSDANILHLSSIFKWYKKDFLEYLQITYPDMEPSLKNYILLYLGTENASRLLAVSNETRIRFLDYDWGLNDQK